MRSCKSLRRLGKRNQEGAAWRNVGICMTDLSDAGKSICHRADVTLTINGCFDLPVVVVYDSGPAEARTYGYPGYPGYVDLVHVWANGVDIRDALPREFLRALEDDIREGL